MTSKLKDLGARAGRWLGLNTPPARQTRVVAADRFDQMDWRDTFDQSAALADLARDLGEDHHYATDLIADVWTAAYKIHPVLRDRADVDPSRAVNHQVIATLLEVPEFTALRRETAGDAYAAAMAVICQRDRLILLLDQAEDAQREAEAAARAERAAAEAAAQVTTALETAAVNAGEGGEVPSVDAEAVRAAIAVAADAEQAAGAAGDRARLVLIQATPGMRALLRAAAADAAEQIRADLALMAAWGVDPGQLQRMDFATRAALAGRLAGGRMGHFADLIGRFKVMATGERARKVENVPGELVGITLGDDVGRLIPSELASLGVPALRAVFAARLAEGQLMLYQTRGEQTVGKGAIIACVDCSGSMVGRDASGVTREVWAKACALALLDQARAAKRDFVGILFSSAGQIATFEFPAKRAVAITQVADFAEHFFGGGTDYAEPLDTAADLLQAGFDADGHQRGDIVFITDGACDVTEDWMQTWNDRKRRLGHRVFGVSIGHSPGPALTALSDSLHTITDLTDPGTTRQMFHVI